MNEELCIFEKIFFMKRIIVISLLFVVCVSCTTKQPKVIFSSENLDSVQWIIQTYDSVSDTWISPKENQLWCLGRDGTMFDYSQGYGNEYARLPDYKDYQIVVACNDAGDNVPIDLCVVKSGIMMLNNALDITHSWLDFDEDEQGNVIDKVTIKDVVIYEGYLICIKTYEQINYEQRKYVRTNYYKINDDGDFYEVDSTWKNVINTKIKTQYDGKIVEVPQEHTEEVLVDKPAEEFSEPKMDIDSNAMFSSKDLDLAQWMLPEEFPLSVLEYDGKISDNTDLLTRLPDYNGDTVVISKKTKGDGAVYTLYVVKSGVLQNGLDITPHYVVSKDKRAYSFKDFVINKDYRISIYTEEKEAGERPQSGGDYYRIDNFGEFYEANW